MGIAVRPRRPGLLAGRSAAVRIGAVAVAAVIVAEAAVWVMRPRGEILDPATVSEHAYFSQAQLDRASDFRDGQRLLGFGTLAVEGAVLVVLAIWCPAPLRTALRHASRRPLLGAAAVGAGISLTLAIVGVPFGIAANERARDVGLSTQDLGSWLFDAGKSAAIGAALAAIGATIAVAMLRRLGRYWWIGGSVAVVLFAVVFSWLGPVLVAPLFNKFQELPPGKTRSQVLRLGEQAGVKIGHVYRVDASRRSTAINAYVDGLGPSKRVVVFDNTLRQLPPAQLRSVLAHELGHVKGNDIVRGIAWLALVAPLGVLFIQLAGGALARRNGDDPRSPGALPALALSMAAALFVLGIASNQLSRRVEARADSFALELTKDPQALIGVQKKLALTNVAEADPPAVLQWLFGTHPDTMQRIGAAVTFERQQR
ncbi:MAG TPA: M48 family metalloprotease [Solirubrobacterales bacterium]|jgi:STE24 endopeptidase